MDTLERLAHWKRIAVDTVRAAGRDGVEQLEARVWKSEDDLFAYFDCFRPDGAGLDKVFAGIVGGAELLQRLRPIYQLKETQTALGYFVVRRPHSATPDMLCQLTTEYLGKAKQIALGIGETDQRAAEIRGLLDSPPRINVVRGHLPERFNADFNVLETLLHELVSDWFIDLKPIPSDALLMREAYYSIAADYFIADHLMWPLYRQSTIIEEPFAAYFELWTHGARPFFGQRGLVTVYLSDNSAIATPSTS
jgi:hypothetical protein